MREFACEYWVRAPGSGSQEGSGHQKYTASENERHFATFRNKVQTYKVAGTAHTDFNGGITRRWKGEDF